MKSNFYQDLSKEELLGTYLNQYYQQIFDDSSYQVVRNQDINLQHRGVDLLLKSATKQYYVDEKAQLDYLNKSLPTFAFEISYLKKDNWKLGWLFDTSKLTDVYFLITSIYPLRAKDLSGGLANIRIIGVYRKKLIALLRSKGLTLRRVFEIENHIRNNNIEEKVIIPELDKKKEGSFYFSKNNKREQPINLVLKLQYLLDQQVGKELFRLRI